MWNIIQGKRRGFFVYLSKMKKMVTPYGTSGGGKKNCSKNEDDQIKKLHNICIYIFFPKAAF